MLGEALGLFGLWAVKMFMAMALAFLLALLPCFFMEMLPGKGRRVRSGGQGAEKRKASLWVLVTAGFLLAGFWRGSQAREWYCREQQMNLDKIHRKVWGNVISIKESGEYRILVLKDCACTPRGKKREEESMGSGERLERLQVYIGYQAGRPRMGSRIQVEGEVSRFAGPRNPGEFDYSLYYRTQKLNYRMFAVSWEALGESYSWPGEFLYQCSEYAGQILEKVADPEDAGIFQAAILGEKGQLDSGIRKLYQKSGIAHLLAISGLHLSLVSGAVYGTLRKLGAGYGMAGAVGCLFLAAYAVMTGASPSVIRAFIMASCGFLAAYLGRSYDLLSALGLSAILLLWDSPYRLCQSGMQLSFGAVAGIGISAELYAQKGCGTTGKGSALWQAMAASGSMQLLTLPVVLYHFFQFPLYGIFLNLLVVPLMGIVVASGTAGIVLGNFSLKAGRFAAGGGHVVLKLYESLCRLWECLPGSCLILGQPDLCRIMAGFGAQAAAFCLVKKGFRCRAAGIAAASVLLLLPIPLKGMEVTFLDVGQGDGICIRTRTKTVLVDGGSTDQKGLGENRLEPFLKSKGISSVDYAVVSHGDQDHISGLLYLLEEGEIGIRHLVLPAAGKGDEIYGRLESLAKRQGGEVSWMGRNDRILLGRLQIRCLYPAADDREARMRAAEERNEHSLVLRVDYGDFHMLLTGDMSGEGEACLLRKAREEAGGNRETELSGIQLLKVSHHGSRYSTGKEWLEEVRPVWAVISYGEGNPYGHPGEEVLESLSERQVQVMETGKSGAVSLRTDGERVWWSLWAGKN